MDDKARCLGGGINSETHCFVSLKPGVKAADVEKVFPAFKQKYYADDPINLGSNVFKMQPLADIHFNTDYNGYADKKYLWAFSLVGIFLIITACVNFVNLATAQALNRSKEVGIRKVLGSRRPAIVLAVYCRNNFDYLVFSFTCLWIGATGLTFHQ